MDQNIKEDIEAALILCNATPQVVFHPYIPEFSPNVLMYREEWPALTDGSETAHASQSITSTSSPDTATAASVRSGKIKSNYAQPKEGQAA